MTLSTNAASAATKSTAVQATKNSYQRAKELRAEYKAAKQYERDTKILSIFGENPETGKRSTGKLIGMSLLIGPFMTAYYCNKADKIQMKRDIAELKGQVEEHKKSSQISKEMFVNAYGIDPQTGKRPLTGLAYGIGPYIIYGKIADKIAKNLENDKPVQEEAPAAKTVKAEEVEE